MEGASKEFEYGAFKLWYLRFEKISIQNILCEL